MDFFNLPKTIAGFLLVLFTGILLVACNSTPDGSVEDGEYVIKDYRDTVNNNEPFYPFIAFLKDEIAYVDSTPFAIEKTVRINGVLIDSGLVERAVLKPLFAQFTAINPEMKALKPLYSESSFVDNSINRLTFSISALDENLPLQQADIHLHPQNKRVKNIVLKKQFTQADSSVLQYLVWETKMHFQISESIQKTSGANYTRITRVVWDKPMSTFVSTAP